MITLQLVGRDCTHCTRSALFQVTQFERLYYPPGNQKFDEPRGALRVLNRLAILTVCRANNLSYGQRRLSIRGIGVLHLDVEKLMFMVGHNFAALAAYMGVQVCD